MTLSVDGMVSVRGGMDLQAPQLNEAAIFIGGASSYLIRTVKLMKRTFVELSKCEARHISCSVSAADNSFFLPVYGVSKCLSVSSEFRSACPVYVQVTTVGPYSTLS